jgi:hypothetical protein
MQGEGRSTTCLLFGLQPLDDGLELAQNLVGLLVVLDLGRDEFGHVAQWLGCVEDLITAVSTHFLPVRYGVDKGKLTFFITLTASSV